MNAISDALVYAVAQINSRADDEDDSAMAQFMAQFSGATASDENALAETH